MSNGPSIKRLHEIIEQAAMSHPSVKSFGAGERHLISNDGGTVPVHVWLEHPIISSVNMNSNGSPTRAFRVQLLVLDIPLEGNPDVVEIISRCDLIACWILLALMNVDGFFVNSNTSILSLSEYHGDLWAGVRLDMEITTNLPINYCDTDNLNIA